MSLETKQSEFIQLVSLIKVNYKSMSIEDQSTIDDIVDLDENGLIDKENIETYIEQLNQLLN